MSASTPASAGTPAAPILVSILNWNGLDDTLACLAALPAPEAGLCDIVVIDNGSASDPTAAIRTRFPHVECIRNSANTGFTGGQNLGMRLALERGYEAVFLLNNDCELQEDTLAALLTSLRSDPKMAAVSPLIYCLEPRDKPQIVGAWIDWPHHTSRRPSQPDAPRPPELPAMVPGTALLLSCAALREVGLLDERYFAYYEDNDLSARIAAAGWLASYCRHATVYHASRPAHQYSELALYLSARNAYLFWHTHTPEAARRGLSRHLLSQSLYEIALLKKAGMPAKCRAVVAGFWDARRGRSGPPPASFQAPGWLNWMMCVAPYLLHELVDHPLRTIATRLRLRRAAA